MRTDPDSNLLQRRLEQCLGSASAWQGVFYRATTIEYSNRRDLLSGLGSRLAGARWTPPGLFAAVYGCLEPETAMSEALANYREFGIPLSQAMPLVFVAVTVETQAVLDLTNPDVQRVLGVTTRRMVNTPWQRVQERGDEALTQCLGRLAWEASLEGILVPSARVKGATNVVLFSHRRRKGSSWKIQRPRSLPKKFAD